MIKLESVYDGRMPEWVGRLYDLLEERPKYVNISHRKMPTPHEHQQFVESKPYEAWYAIIASIPDGNDFVGSIYLTRQREIGVFIKLGHQRKGYARQAIARLRELHPGPLLANVAPNNGPSHSLFKKLGGRVIQYTYEL